MTPDPGSRDDPRGGVDTNALTSAAIVPESTMRFTHPRQISPTVATAYSVAVTWLIKIPQEVSHGSLRSTRSKTVSAVSTLSRVELP